MRYTSKIDYSKLADKIKDEFYRPINAYKITIFLCGADLKQKEKLRFQISEILTKNYWNSFLYDVVFPEDIFEELLYSSKKRDLLSLENMLAESVDSIIIIPESPGSFAELGAFANSSYLCKKIICIIDKKYKKEKSFINQGPLKLVKKANKEGLLFVDPYNLEFSLSPLQSSLKKIKKQSSKISDKISLLQLENFLLPSIFLLGSVYGKTLEELVAYATKDKINPFQATTAALSMLIKKRKLELTSKGYKLTRTGLDTFLNLQKTSCRIKTQNETIARDNLRLKILNYKLRNKPLKV